MIVPPVSPSAVLRYDSVIRLTQYVPDPGSAPSASAFIAAWQEAAEASSTSGILYRELCRQVPEWSALAKKEIDNPIEAAFLEYLIVEPGTDLSKIPALPSTQNKLYSIIQDIHNVAFHFAKQEQPEKPGAWMFNLFEIDGPAGMEQGFLMAWPPRGEFKIQEPATLSTVLHQRMLPGARIKAFNRAEVTSAEAYAEGIGRFEAAFPRVERKAGAEALPGTKPPIRSHLGLFEIVAVGPTRPSRLRATMKAVTATDFGPPSVLRLATVPLPSPGPGQVRVKVIASSINPLDIKMRAGEVRHIYPAWFPEVYGYSVAGVIDAIGERCDTQRRRGSLRD